MLYALSWKAIEDDCAPPKQGPISLSLTHIHTHTHTHTRTHARTQAHTPWERGRQVIQPKRDREDGKGQIQVSICVPSKESNYSGLEQKAALLQKR